MPKLINKIRFIQAVRNDELKLRNMNNREIAAQLDKLGFLKLRGSSSGSSKSGSIVGEGSNDDGGLGGELTTDASSNSSNLSGGEGNYDYLIKMRMDAVSVDNAAKLQREHDTLSARISALRDTSPERMWLADIDTLEKQLLSIGEW